MRRMCSGCGERGHYVTTCPHGWILHYSRGDRVFRRGFSSLGCLVRGLSISRGITAQKAVRMNGLRSVETIHWAALLEMSDMQRGVLKIEESPLVRRAVKDLVLSVAKKSGWRLGKQFRDREMRYNAKQQEICSRAAWCRSRGKWWGTKAPAWIANPNATRAMNAGLTLGRLTALRRVYGTDHGAWELLAMANADGVDLALVSGGGAGPAERDIRELRKKAGDGPELL